MGAWEIAFFMSSKDLLVSSPHIKETSFFSKALKGFILGKIWYKSTNEVDFSEKGLQRFSVGQGADVIYRLDSYGINGDSSL
jgi:hypothetical protein